MGRNVSKKSSGKKAKKDESTRPPPVENNVVTEPHLDEHGRHLHRGLQNKFAPKPLKPTKKKTLYSGTTPPIPDPQLLDLIHNFLTDFRYVKAAHGMRTDNQKRPGHNMHTDWKWACMGMPDLLTLFHQWQQAYPGKTPVRKTHEQMMNEEKAARAAALEIDGPVLGQDPKDAEESDEDMSTSATDSLSDTDSSDESSVSSLSESSSDSEDDDDSESESDSESDEDEEEEQAPAKKQKLSETTAKPVAAQKVQTKVVPADATKKQAKALQEDDSYDDSTSSSDPSSSSVSDSSDEDSDDEDATTKMKPQSMIAKAQIPTQVVSKTNGKTSRDSSPSSSDPSSSSEDSSSVSSSGDDSDDSSSDDEKTTTIKSAPVSQSTNNNNLKRKHDETLSSSTSKATPAPPQTTTTTPSSTTTTTTTTTKGKPPKNQKPFSRIKDDQFVDARFASNEFVPYDYAQRAHEKLIVTKGKDFTKAKNKGKRGSYRGGFIDTSAKGIKFDD